MDLQHVDLFCLLSLERSTRTRAVWWAPNTNGYVDSAHAAGRYTEAEVLTLLALSDGGDVPVPAPWALIYDAMRKNGTLGH